MLCCLRSTVARRRRRTLALAVAVIAVSCAVSAILTGGAGSAGASASAPAPTCGGARHLKADGTAWICTFDDEFDTTTGDAAHLDTAKLVVQQTSTSGFHNGPECYVNSPNNVSVSGGHLNLTARQEPTPFVCQSPHGNYTTQYTSAEVSTAGTFSQTYGRFEVRAKLPAAMVKGLQESFWLWPVNDLKYGAWPASGEIDFAEIYHDYPDRAVPYLHYLYKPSTADLLTETNVVTNGYCLIADLAQFHTYAVEWSPTVIRIIYDGRTCLMDRWAPAAGQTHPAPFDQPFFIVLTQALGIGPNAFQPATTPLPATTEIDYVRAWK
jgi:beta-glucanase (GH16 family)